MTSVRLTQEVRAAEKVSHARTPGVPGSRGLGRAALVLILPFFVLFTLVTILPILYSFYLSLFQEKQNGLYGGGGTTQVFVGLANFGQVLSDPQYVTGYLNIVIYVLIYVPVLMIGAMAVALFLDSAVAKLKRTLQFSLFVPHLVPGIIASLLWLYLYIPQISPFAKALSSVGVEGNILTPGGVFPAIANIGVWAGLGYNMVIFYAALQAIPQELTEAARIDGASGFRVAVSVKLPLIRGSVGLAMLFSAVGALQVFTEPLILHQYSSGLVSSGWSPNLYAYTQAFGGGHNYPLAACASLLLAVFSALLSFLVTRFAKPWSSQ
ncbi:carbohydrate ABC transporter permease [Rathayibacter sp. CAU 1779]